MTICRPNSATSVIVTHNGLFGGQDPYAVRGHREFCPCCEDSHDRNRAFLTHLGGLFFRYKCMNPHAPHTVELDLREFHRSRAPQQASPPPSRYLPSFTHIKCKVISCCAGMGTGKTHQIENDMDDTTPKRVFVITCRRGMAATLTGRFSGFTSYLDAINEDHQIIEYEITPSPGPPQVRRDRYGRDTIDAQLGRVPRNEQRAHGREHGRSFAS